MNRTVWFSGNIVKLFKMCCLENLCCKRGFLLELVKSALHIVSTCKYRSTNLRMDKNMIEIAEMKIRYNGTTGKYQVDEQIGNEVFEFDTLDEIVSYLQRNIQDWKDEASENSGVYLPD